MNAPSTTSSGGAGSSTREGYVVSTEYSDAAQSGATMHRPQLQQLLTYAKRRGGAPFSAVLVDDLSRLSRDLGNTWRLVFEDLFAANVVVIDCTSDMASDGAGARLTFGALAFVNDQFLESVRKQTPEGWRAVRCPASGPVVAFTATPHAPRMRPRIRSTRAPCCS